MGEAFERVGQSPEVAALADPPTRAPPLVVPKWVPPQLMDSGGTHVDASLPPTARSNPGVRRSFKWVGAFIAFAVLGSGIGVVASKLGATQSPATPQVIPTPPPPKPEPQPLPPPPPPPALVEDKPPPPHEEPPPDHAPHPPAVKKGPGEVRCVTTTPDGESSWAYVDVDGLRKGTTPLTLKLPPGEHELVFRRPGFATQTRKVTSVAGEVKRLTVELKP